MPRYCFANHDEYSCAFILVTPFAGGVLREVDRARTPESQVRVNSRRLDPVDQLLSITAGRNTLAEGIHERETEIAGARISRRNNYQDLTTFSPHASTVPTLGLQNGKRAVSSAQGFQNQGCPPKITFRSDQFSRRCGLHFIPSGSPHVGRH